MKSVEELEELIKANRTKQRLLSISTREVSIVDVPANLRPFAVIKSQNQERKMIDPKLKSTIKELLDHANSVDPMAFLELIDPKGYATPNDTGRVSNLPASTAGDKPTAPPAAELAKRGTPPGFWRIR